MLGPNINAAMDPAKAPLAWKLLQKARANTDNVTPRERAYIRALSKRYGPEALDDRSPRDLAFARAMGKVAKRYPQDPDAKALYAEALMDTTPWDYWQEDGSPKPVTKRIKKSLEGVIREHPLHPLANHLMIHTVEEMQPRQGLKAAKRLEDLVPGAGHLVHMPAHIYIRLGRYHEATAANLRAIEADRRYLQQVDAAGVYRLAYVPHNYHFGWATATLEGRGELALRLAHEMAQIVDTEAMRTKPLATLQHYWITPVYAQVRFGRWGAILERKMPAQDLVYPRAVLHYARGIAYTRQDNLPAAKAELDRLDELRKDERLEWVTVWDINKSQHILKIAHHTLAGEIAAAEGDFDDAIDELEDAVASEDKLNYDEPPSWHHPVRQSLGAVLLEAGDPGRAEKVYRQDLKRFPENGWSLFGLQQSLRRQGKREQAKAVEQRFNEAWQHADVTLRTPPASSGVAQGAGM